MLELAASLIVTASSALLFVYWCYHASRLLWDRDAIDAMDEEATEATEIADLPIV